MVVSLAVRNYTRLVTTLLRSGGRRRLREPDPRYQGVWVVLLRWECVRDCVGLGLALGSDPRYQGVVLRAVVCLRSVCVALNTFAGCQVVQDCGLESVPARCVSKSVPDRYLPSVSLLLLLPSSSSSSSSLSLSLSLDSVAVDGCCVN
jgi:hypothetical protein